MGDADLAARLDRAAAYVEIVELLARYAAIVDSRAWNEFDLVFTPGIRFDVTSIGLGVHRGLEELKSHMAAHPRHPAAHLIVNVVADIDGDRASATSRLLALQRDGRMFTGQYKDGLVRTDAGWRIESRVYARLQQPSDAAMAQRPDG
jgi:hypothetical protein